MLVGRSGIPSVQVRPALAHCSVEKGEPSEERRSNQAKATLTLTVEEWPVCTLAGDTVEE